MCVCVCVVRDERFRKNTECETGKNDRVHCREVVEFTSGRRSQRRGATPKISDSAPSTGQRSLLLIVTIHPSPFDHTSECSSCFHIMHIIFSVLLPSVKERRKSQGKGEDIRYQCPESRVSSRS